MKLYLLQHGEALGKEVDPERPLSDRGRDDIARLAAWLQAGGVTVARIAHSGKTRARQSAEILAPALGCVRPLEARDDIAPNDPPEPLAAALAQITEDLLLAGHLPFMARLVDCLLAGQGLVAYQPGSLVALERDEGSWQLIWMVRPALLGPI